MNINEKALWELPGFEDELVGILGSRKKSILPAHGHITAAVLVPIFKKDGRRHILLTKRSDLVEHHRGEISFPGGKLDSTDPNLESCALRETSEELGVSPEHVQILGELDDFYTVATPFRVIPFVGLIPYPYEFRISAREIEALISPPLEIFFDPTRRSEETRVFEDRQVRILSYHWEGHTIWGATARILNHLVLVINGKSGSEVDETVCLSVP